MKNSELYNRLSVSAKNTLDEYLEELKYDILKQAESETNTKGNNEIRLKEIISAIKKVGQQDDSSSFVVAKKRRMYMILSMTGLLYAVFGMAYYLYSSGKLDIKENIGMVMTILGLIITVIAFLFSQFASLRGLKEKTRYVSKKINIDDKNIELFKRWQLIESLSKAILVKSNVPDKDIKFKDILQYLNENFAKDVNEKQNIQELLGARNKIAHEGYISSTSELERMIEYSDKVINELDKLSRKSTTPNTQ